MGAQTTSNILVLLFLFLTVSSSYNHKGNNKHYKPCKSLVLYFHDILYNGKNAVNATSAIVGAPQGGNLTTLASHDFFGDVVVMDDPITLDNNPHSPPVGRAQGQYIFVSKNTFTAWVAISFVLNSSDYQGSFHFTGVERTLMKARDIPIVGGTGDFFMHRGIATFMTEAVEFPVYFMLRVDIKFYECW